MFGAINESKPLSGVKIMKPNAHLQDIDPLVARLIDEENTRQRDVLRLIPSENYASHAVLAATGSCMTNKYSEGYAQKRYYQGQGLIDQVEELAISRAKSVFGAEHVNVQPYSGSPANLAVYFALRKGRHHLEHESPHGGHLTYGESTISAIITMLSSTAFVKATIESMMKSPEWREHKPNRSSAEPRPPANHRLSSICNRQGSRRLPARGHRTHFGLVAGAHIPLRFRTQTLSRPQLTKRSRPPRRDDYVS